METKPTKLLLSLDNDLMKSKEVLQKFVEKHSNSSDFIATYEEWNVIWNAMYKFLQMPSSGESEGCLAIGLATIRIMARDKTHLNEMITDDQFGTLLNVAKIGSYNENSITIADLAIVAEALKCLCNLVYESTTCQTMCSKIDDIDGIVQRLATTYKDANMFSDDLPYFDVKFLFLIMALNPNTRTKVRYDHHCLTYLVDILCSINKNRSVPENEHQELEDSQVNLLVEIMKALFIITDRNETSVASKEKENIEFWRLAVVLHDFLLCQATSSEKQIELRSNILNLLSNVPTACYSELTIPMHIHIRSLVDGIDWNQRISHLRSTLRFDIGTFADTTSKDAAFSMEKPKEIQSLQSNVSANIDESLSSDKSKQSTKFPKTECPDCGKHIVTKVLDRHRRQQHQGEKTKCTLCDFETKRPDYLIQHMQYKHFEKKPMGRPRKNENPSGKRQRGRSPFKRETFDKRHKSSLTMIEMNDIKRCEELNEIKEKMVATENEFANKEQRLIERFELGMKELDSSRKKTELEVSKIKTRVNLVESKQIMQPLPDVRSIPALLKYFNLDETCSKNDINAIINLRLQEIDSESKVSGDIFTCKRMTQEKREEMIFFCNDASTNLLKWRKQKDLLQKDVISIES